MSKPASILSALLTQLRNSSDLNYVNDESILLGVRESISFFPCIILEPLALLESDEIHDRQELTFRIAVIGYIETTLKDKQIVGDANTKGILDFENDVKKAISSDLTMGGNAIHTQIVETRYEFVNFPVRSFAMDVEVWFRQTAAGRT